MRLIAERLLPPEASGLVYLHGELTMRRPRAPALPPRRKHLCCSTHNPGAARLLDETNAALGGGITYAEGVDEGLDSCDRLLLYLNRATWTHAPAALAADVERALASGVGLLLVREAPVDLP